MFLCPFAEPVAMHAEMFHTLAWGLKRQGAKTFAFVVIVAMSCISKQKLGPYIEKSLPDLEDPEDWSGRQTFFFSSSV